MTVDRLVEVAKLVGYRLHRDFPAYRPMPFSKYHPVRIVVLRLPPSDQYVRDVELYEPLSTQHYTKRYLIELNKNNKRFLEKMRSIKGVEDVVAALDFCT